MTTRRLNLGGLSKECERAATSSRGDTAAQHQEGGAASANADQDLQHMVLNLQRLGVHTSQSVRELVNILCNCRSCPGEDNMGDEGGPSWSSISGRSGGQAWIWPRAALPPHCNGPNGRYDGSKWSRSNSRRESRQSGAQFSSEQQQEFL